MTPLRRRRSRRRRRDSGRPRRALRHPAPAGASPGGPVRDRRGLYRAAFESHRPRPGRNRPPTVGLRFLENHGVRRRPGARGAGVLLQRPPRRLAVRRPGRRQEHDRRHRAGDRTRLHPTLPGGSAHGSADRGRSPRTRPDRRGRPRARGGGAAGLAVDVVEPRARRVGGRTLGKLRGWGLAGTTRAASREVRMRIQGPVRRVRVTARVAGERPVVVEREIEPFAD